MPTLRMSYSTATAITASINSLENNTSVISSPVTNATNLYTDCLVEILIATGTGTSPTGYVEVFAKASIDNTDFSSDTADRKIGVVATPAASTTYKLVTSIASAYGGAMPQYWQLRIRNVSGAALAGSGNSASYSGVLLTSS